MNIVRIGHSQQRALSREVKVKAFSLQIKNDAPRGWRIEAPVGLSLTHTIPEETGLLTVSRLNPNAEV